MTQALEEAVKALAEFEAELDRIKTDASEARKRLVKTAADEAEKAKGDAVAKAQELADGRGKVAKQEAEGEAAEIGKRGGESLNPVKAATLERKEGAGEFGVRRVPGG